MKKRKGTKIVRSYSIWLKVRDGRSGGVNGKRNRRRAYSDILQAPLDSKSQEARHIV